MASRGQAIPLIYRAWNTSTNAPATGDSANHTLTLKKCNAGTASSASPTNAPTELGNGDYQVLLTSGEATNDTVCVNGSSSTPNVILIGVPYTFEQAPTAAPGAAGGSMINGANTGTPTYTGGLTVEQDFTQTLPTSPTSGTTGSALSYADSRVGRRGTAQGGTSSTITLDTGASATDNAYQNHEVKITGGTGSGQFATITGYVGSTKVATIHRATGTWTTTPDNTSVFLITASPEITLTAKQPNVAWVHNDATVRAGDANDNALALAASIPVLKFDPDGYVLVDVATAHGSMIAHGDPNVAGNLVNFLTYVSLDEDHNILAVIADPAQQSLLGSLAAMISANKFTTAALSNGGGGTGPSIVIRNAALEVSQS